MWTRWAAFRTSRRGSAKLRRRHRLAIVENSERGTTESKGTGRPKFIFKEIDRA